MEIHRLPIHSKARIKSPEERQAHRRHKYQEYFRDQHPLELKLHQVKVLGLTSSVEVYSHAACGELKGLPGEDLPPSKGLKINRFGCFPDTQWGIIAQKLCYHRRSCCSFFSGSHAPARAIRAYT